MARNGLQHLIWVYTVLQNPTYECRLVSIDNTKQKKKKKKKKKKIHNAAINNGVCVCVCVCVCVLFCDIIKSIL